MLLLLKIAHLLCLFGGGAAGIGNTILMRRVVGSGKPPEPIVASTMKTLGMIGLGSIVLLWLTGLWMIWGFGLGGSWAFYAKLIVAAVVLLAVLGLNFTAARAESSQRAPDPDRMKALSLVSSGGAVLAVILAVIAFK